MIEQMLAAVEEALLRLVRQVEQESLEGMFQMLAYHLGWWGEGAGPEARGKRVRPLLLLLTNAAAGGHWHHALPAAAAVELLHNFSLIHDDIQDHSDLRRGRPTVWKLWGVPQAINAGDALFALAYLALQELAETPARPYALAAGRVFGRACLSLTQGQYLDLYYEGRGDLSTQAYWPMVAGKTAALLSACTELGALVAGAEAERVAAYANYGRYLGLAFQVQDDWLGIWGNAALTGKSTESDLLAGKKSLPVLIALERSAQFAERWAQGALTADEIPGIIQLMEAAGVREETQRQADELTTQALNALRTAQPQGEAGQALIELTSQLLKRKS